MKFRHHFLKPILFVLLLFQALVSFTQSSSGFVRSTPEAEGVSSTDILTFIEAAENRVDAMHSFMIIRHGKLISEGWWAPYDAETPHRMHSLSKSFTSTAIGLAIDEGILSLNDQVISFFPEYVPEKPTYNLKAMRIRDLITMNTGHIKEPRPRAGGDNWVKTFLEAEVPLKPGTHFKYNSAATYMLSAILQKVTGEKLVDFLEPRLFEPLNIKKPNWDTCPKGINTGGWGLHIVTEDIAKLGQLYLQKGKWNGKQLLSEEWVKMATSKQVSNGSNPENDWEQGYGFQFWRCRYNCYRGDGAMGQFCIVMPEHDAVVAITSGVNNMGEVMNVVWETLLPAMKTDALQANPQKLEELKQKTTSLTLKPIEGETSSPISKKIAKKTFHISQNEAGIKSISFNLHKDTHAITVAMKHGIETIEIGSNNYQKGNINQHIPYTNNLLQSIAANGAWTKPNEYQLRVYLYETPARINYTFRFQDGKLIWDSKLEHSLFGPRNQGQLIGK